MSEVCDICGSSTKAVNTHDIFIQVRCTPCLELFGETPIETLKAKVISDFGLKIEDMSLKEWFSLVHLQKKRWDIKKTADKDAENAKKSLLNIGREKGIIAKIRDKEDKEKKSITERINQAICELAVETDLNKHDLEEGDTTHTEWTHLVDCKNQANCIKHQINKAQKEEQTKKKQELEGELKSILTEVTNIYQNIEQRKQASVS